jgi:hypothetical protein
MKNYAPRLTMLLIGVACPLVVCSSAQAQTGTLKPKVTTPPVAKAKAPAPSGTKLSEKKAQEMVARVLRETSQIRELSIKRGVKSAVMTSANVEKMMRGKIKDEMPSKQTQGSEIFLRQLDMVPADFNLTKTTIKMLGEQIAGFYATETKTFTTTDRVDPLQLETVMAHELTHALQDQHYDLTRLEKWPKHDGDARLAMQALVEGDATLVMSRYTAKNPMRFLGVLASSLKAGNSSPTFNNAPRFLKDSLTFPYVKGLDFVNSLYRMGGWKVVSDAYYNLPQSSEQILHVDKYLDGEAPVEVKLRDLTPTLGAGWTLLDHDVNGEIGLFYVLAEPLKDDRATEAAAAGWAGDRYSVYRGPKGVLVVQDTRWDSPKEAQQWREAYARAAVKRFGAQAQRRGQLEVWSKGKKGLWMEQRGNRVLMLEGTVGAFDTNAVRSALWK